MIGGGTRVYALLGHPITHSRSPALHNRWFAEHGLDAVYVPFDTADPAAIDAGFTLGLRGANLTTPLKEAAATRVRCEPEAGAIGAVNVLVRDPGGWVGANTDAEGFCRSLTSRGVTLRGRRCVVLGAGGAARAVVVGLARSGAASIDVRARRPDAARAVATLVGGSSGPIGARSVDGADLIVVATAGRAASVAALELDRLGPGAVWVDLNYWDPDPPGFRRAEAAGCTTIDGWGMLVWQAALAFERWTSILPDVNPLVTAGPVSE